MSERPNRRTAVRHDRRMKVPCSMKRVIEEDAFEATVAIVSPNAVRLLVAAPPPCGAHLAVDLPNARGRSVGMLFRVSLTRPLTDRPGYVVEGRFVKKLGARAVDAARARLAAVSHGNAWKTTCRSIRILQEGPWLATMQNVSHSGIGLITEQPFNPGTFLEVRLPSIRRQHLQPRIVRVTNSRRQPDGEDWSVGAVFVRALTDAELQVLL